MSVLVVGVAFMVLVSYLVLLTASECKPKPFSPLESHPIIITTSLAVPGEHLEVRDGICNTSDEAITVDLYLKLQAQTLNLDGEQVIGPTYDLVGTSRNPEHLTLYPGCVGTQPVGLMIPDDVAPGRYSLTLDVTTFSATGEIQRIVSVSDPFEVVADNGGN